MKKNKGILSLILTAVLVVLLGFTVLVGFGKTGTGAMKNIKLGLDQSLIHISPFWTIFQRKRRSCS